MKLRSLTTPFFAVWLPVLSGVTGCSETTSTTGGGGSGGTGLMDAAAPDTGTGGTSGNGGTSGAGGRAGTTSDAGNTDAPSSTDAPSTNDAADGGDAGRAVKRVIVFVWDGLRPDSINATDTPRLVALAQSGVTFNDNHATYPTFTMMNGASFATGGFPGTTGFYGNTLYEPGASGTNASGAVADFSNPIFTEDYGILQDLDLFYGNQLLLVGTLFQAAQSAGLKTCAVGKRGPAFLQDFKKGGIILDEDTVFPLSVAQGLQDAGAALPKNTAKAYDAGVIQIPAGSDPTASPGAGKLSDGVTNDPADDAGSRNNKANAFMMSAYVDYILPQNNPDLTLIWMRSPDSTEHAFGPGTSNYRDALHAQDELLGQLTTKLAALGLQSTTDIIIVSDHGHSSVSGSFDLFPLRGVDDGGLSDPSSTGFSASGDVRLADLMMRSGEFAGIPIYDGNGCVDDPVMSGVFADGGRVYPRRFDDPDGGSCGRPDAGYVTGDFRIKGTPSADSIIIAANGGSDYVYVPSHNATIVGKAVQFLQSRQEFGAIFLSARYGAMDGTLPMSQIKVENIAGRHPDIIVSYDFDENAMVQGLRGIEYESAQNNRGMHGSFSPIDVHNTLVAAGPSFRAAFVDMLPTGNVDVAPTVAKIFGLALPDADGRALLEALATGGAQPTDYLLDTKTVNSSTATAITVRRPTDPAGKDIDMTKSSYSIQLKTKSVTYQGKTSIYFDSAKATRQ